MAWKLSTGHSQVLFYDFPLDKFLSSTCIHLKIRAEPSNPYINSHFWHKSQIQKRKQNAVPSLNIACVRILHVGKSLTESWFINFLMGNNLLLFLISLIQSGHGIEEKSIISILGNSHADQRQSFRKRSDFFVDDERRFEKWDDHHVKILKHEFMRFKVHILSSFQLILLINGDLCSMMKNKCCSTMRGIYVFLKFDSIKQLCCLQSCFLQITNGIYKYWWFLLWLSECCCDVCYASLGKRCSFGKGSLAKGVRIL